ncbi:MAG: HNH endonuclease, partial [Actinomycetota bacterium]|nr:HNH endonuclease [Actinomycetota bacterium]
YGICSVTYAGTNRVHRVVYQLLVDDIQPGHELDHACRNRGCVNPAHLRPGTHGQNMRNVVANRGSASGIRGVNLDRRSGKWVAQCYKDGRNNFGGYFTDLDEAEQAAIALRERLYS